MKPPLRSVPWCKPARDFHRPSRRVTPVRQRTPMVWTPETMGERWEALCHRSRFWRGVNAVGIVLLLTVAFLALAFLMLSVAIRFGGGR